MSYAALGDHRQIRETLESRAPTCPYPTDKVDFCTHAVMVFRGRHTTCDYINIVDDGQGARALCVCSQRLLRAPA